MLVPHEVDFPSHVGNSFFAAEVVDHELLLKNILLGICRGVQALHERKVLCLFLSVSAIFDSLKHICRAVQIKNALTECGN